MKALTDEIIRFFQKQQFTIVSTVGRNRIPHNACKGIVEINRNGKIYILDLYKGRTYTNLRQNPYISITAVDEHKFKGWCLKGKADIIAGKKIKLSYNKRQFYDRILTPMKSMGLIDYDLYKKTYKISDKFCQELTKISVMWRHEIEKPSLKLKKK